MNYEGCCCPLESGWVDKLSVRARHHLVFLGWSGIVNSLAPGKLEWNFRHVIFKQILMIDGWGISCEIALIWMSLDFTDDQSTSVQVMAWCRQATSHYLSQCWSRSLLPYDVTRPQWVNPLPLRDVKNVISAHLLWIKFMSTYCGLLSGECLRAPLMRSQHCIR